RIAQSPRDAWEGAIRDWFRKTRAVSWKQALPSLVVVPTRSHAHALKIRLLREGQSHLGIHFITPGRLRDLLPGERTRMRPLREHLRLLLAIAAEEILRESPEQESNGDELAAKAVVRAPDHLLRTLDRLEMAGWNFDALQLPSFQPIVRRFREQLRACDFSLVAQFDREAMAHSAARPPVFANLLITGFDAAHWSHWFLLRAAVAAAENAMIVLEYPRENLSGIDACWIGSWEEALGEATPIWPAANKTSGSLFSEAEMQGAAVRPASCSFVVGADTSEQAEAVALTCLRFLAQEKYARIGVIFVAAGSLPRLVASALSKRSIPHKDVFGIPRRDGKCIWAPEVDAILDGNRQSQRRLGGQGSWQLFPNVVLALAGRNRFDLQRGSRRGGRSSLRARATADRPAGAGAGVVAFDFRGLD